MKALIISESKDTADLLGAYAQQSGYDTITYKWLLKALDNVEEIAPHVVILSAIDYPRHWKTFVQYTETCIEGFKPGIILITPEDFDESEIQKAHWLGVRGYITGTDESQLEKFRQLLYREPAEPADKDTAVQTAGDTDLSPVQDNSGTEDDEHNVFSEYSADDIPESAVVISDAESAVNTEIAVSVPSETTDFEQQTGSVSDSCKFLFIHPKTGSFVTGKVVQFDPPLIVFMPDQKNILNLKSGTLIADATLKNEHGVYSVQAEIVESSTALTLRYEISE